MKETKKGNSIKKRAKVKLPAIPATKFSNIVQMQRFIEEYCRDFNGTQAAIRAGYSPKTAYSQASRLLRNVKVQKKINQIIGELAAQAKLSAQNYWQHLQHLIDFDPALLFNESGMPKDLKDIPKSTRKCLKLYKVTKKILNNGRDIILEVSFVFPDPLAVVKELGAALRITARDTGAGNKRILGVIVNSNPE